MARDLRLRAAGMLFYFIVVACICATTEGLNIIRSHLTESQPRLLLALLGLGIAIFTSEAIGFVFSSLHIFLWNRGWLLNRNVSRGFAREFERLSYDLKAATLGRYQRYDDNATQPTAHTRFESRWGKFTNDVFVSFFWQQAPRPIVEWVTRRHTAFFVGSSACFAIALGLIVSILLIAWLGFSFSLVGHGIIFVVSIAGIAVIRVNANYARVEALQMMDLWLARLGNPHLRKALDEMSSEGNTRAPELSNSGGATAV